MNRSHEQQLQDAGSSASAGSTAWDRARRPKAQLSCVACRIKKQKCDRNRPCQNCSKKNPSECVYVDGPPLPSQLGKAVQKRNRGSSFRISDRLQILEAQIARLADKTSRLGGDEGEASPFDPSTGDSTGSQDGSDRYHDEGGEERLRLPSERTGWHYISPSHWESILDDLEEIKQEASLCNSSVQAQFERDTSKPADLAGPHILFANQGSTTIAELISALPAKSIVDQLLAVFLSQEGIPPLVSVVLHAPTLLQECDQFWMGPQHVNLVWLSILYSVLSISLQTVLRADRQIDGLLLPELSCKMYTAKAALCLKLSDYARPVKYTVEAMLLNLASEHFWIEKEPFRASLMLGMIVRTAQRIGYHREPGEHTQKTVFDAEMQRRTWALIRQMDLFLAGKCALPRFISHGQSDTAPPANLLDEDLSKDMSELPASRPISQRTLVGYLNYKTRLLMVHGRIIDQLNSSSRITYEETLRLDGELIAQVNTRPPWLDPPLTYEASTSHPIGRLGPLIDADMIVQRARMVLHYKHAIAARQDPIFWKSRELSTKAAETALVYQRILFDAAARSGGIKRHWRLLSLLDHDFLLAVMVLSCNIDQDLLTNKQSNNSETLFGKSSEDYLRHLQSSYEVWKASLNHSPSAREAHDIVKSIFERFLKARNQVLQQPTVIEMEDSAHLGTNLTGEFSSIQLDSDPYTQSSPTFIGEQDSRAAYPGNTATSLNFVNPYPPGFPQDTNQLQHDPLVEEDMIDTFLGGVNWPSWNLNGYDSSMGLF